MIAGANLRVSVLALLVAGMGLAGCGVGGTTYGTGVGQEKQTLEDLSNIFTLRKKSKVIDYSARPNLVIPEEKKLVEPVDEATTTSSAEWPESPEERIARIRAEAEEAQSSPTKQLKFNQSQKKYRLKTDKPAAENEAPLGQGIPNVSCDPDGIIMRQCTPDEISRAVRAERATTASLSGSRRYLTDPPDVYRTPVSTAPAGDETFTEAELKEIERQRKIRETESKSINR